MISNIETPLKILRYAANYFVEKRIGFWKLLTFSIAMKICRFIAFLLPFKALLLVITDERQIEILEVSTSSTNLSVLILLIALLFFIVQWTARNSYNSSIAALFGRTADIEVGSIVSAIDPHPDTEKVLKAVVNFYSAIIITFFIAITLAYIFPYGLILLSFLTIIFFYYLLISLEPNIPGSFDIPLFNQFFSFFSMVTVLIFFAVLINFKIQIGLLSGLFVFIGIRQVFIYLGEVATVLNNYRRSTLPRFIRKSLDNTDGTTLFLSPTIPPYLKSASQLSWISIVLEGALERQLTILNVGWRQSPIRSVNSFDVKVAQGDGSKTCYLLNIYSKSNFDSYNRELNFQINYQKCLLSLPLAGIHRSSDYATLVYSLENAIDINRAEYVSSIPELLKQLWTSEIPDYLNIEASEVDFLDHLNQQTFDMLRTIAINDEEEAVVEFVYKNLRLLKQLVSSIPCGLHNPDINSLTTLVTKGNRFRVTMWGRIDIDPLGCMLWHLPSQDNTALQDIVSYLQENRSDCEALKISDLELAATSYGLSKNIINKSLNIAMKDIEKLAAMLEK